MNVRIPLLLFLLALPAWAGNGDQPAQLEPVIVEGQRSELDSRAAIFRDMTPCIGECPDEPQERTGPVERVLRGIETLFIASSLPERPRPQDSLGIVNPTQTRLDQKLP